MQHAKPGEWREQQETAGVADKAFQPAEATVTSSNVAVGGFMQRREDEVDQDSIKRNGNPIGKVTANRERRAKHDA